MLRKLICQKQKKYFKATDLWKQITGLQYGWENIIVFMYVVEECPSCVISIRLIIKLAAQERTNYLTLVVNLYILNSLILLRLLVFLTTG